MIIDEKLATRVGIYVFYDKDCIVDDYVIYFLKELKKSVAHLLIVINGQINNEGFIKLQNVVDDILIRPNEGYDITGYLAGIKHLTWDVIDQFDECIFANSTLYGPIYSFEEMFATMARRDIDFWGITKFHECSYVFDTCKYKYTPEHIQSSFLVIRKSMGVSPLYKDVWNNLPTIHSYEEAIGIFELPFTKEAKEKGFIDDVYIDTSDLYGYTRYPLMMMADELIINRKCPVMKQKSFSQWYYDILTDTSGMAAFNAFEYINQYTSYDVNLIWDNILRINNMADIKNHLKLNYILPKYSKFNEQTNKKVALVMHLYYPDLVEYCLRYACFMPKGAEIIITTPSKEVKSIVYKNKAILEDYTVDVVEIENRGRDVSALLVGAYPKIYEFDYVCFVHDKKTNYIEPFCNGLSYFEQCMENLLASTNFVMEVIKCFDEHERLGILMPPPPCHGDFYEIASSEWAGDYELTLELAKKLNLHCKIEGGKPPISPLGTMFWFRPEALRTLFEYGWSYLDFPQEPNGTDGTILHAVERLYGYVCQNDGYYPAWLLNDQYASGYMNNLYFMLREINLKAFPYFRPRHFFDFINRFDTYIAHADEINSLRRMNQACNLELASLKEMNQACNLEIVSLKEMNQACALQIASMKEMGEACALRILELEKSPINKIKKRIKKCVSKLKHN